MKPNKNTICLWFDKDAHEAARFYAATFPNSEVNAVHKAPGDFPGVKEGDELTVEFTVLGIPPSVSVAQFNGGMLESAANNKHCGIGPVSNSTANCAACGM